MKSTSSLLVLLGALMFVPALGCGEEGNVTSEVTEEDLQLQEMNDEEQDDYYSQNPDG